MENEDVRNEIKSVLGLENSNLDIPELDPYIFKHHNAINDKEIIILPTLHGQAGFCRLVSKSIAEQQPNLLVTELPNDLKAIFEVALNRLPLSTLIYSGDLETEGTRTLPPHPSNAYVIYPGEALYWGPFMAKNLGMEYRFIDTWHPDAHQTWMSSVDYASLSFIGWSEFWKNSYNLVVRHCGDQVHFNRSLGMAERILELSKDYDKILVVVGAAHWPVISQKIAENGYVFPTENGLSQEILEYIGKMVAITQKIPEKRTWELADIHPHSLHLVIPDLPYYSSLMVEDPLSFNYIEAIRQLYFQSEVKYNKLLAIHIEKQGNYILKNAEFDPEIVAAQYFKEVADIYHSIGDLKKYNRMISKIKNTYSE